jgi:hypothetical protein
MSVEPAGPVIVHIDRSTPTGCLTYAATEARRRGRGLVVVTAGPRPAKARPELDAVRAAHPGLVETATYEGSDASFVVTAAAHPALAAVPAGVPLVVFRPTVAPAAPAPPVVVALDVEPADHALEFAIMEAQLRATTVRAVYLPKRLDAAVDPAVESALRETLDRWADKYPMSECTSPSSPESMPRSR